MTRTTGVLSPFFVALLPATLLAQKPERNARDSAFAAMQARGAKVMGVNQYTSTHHFDSLADGGRIVLQRNKPDPAGTRTIRAHLRRIAADFSRGDFALPEEVHARVIPGSKVMAAKRHEITYTFEPLPRGGEVRIRSRDPEAIRAIHEFLAFQRQAHHAGGTVSHP